MTLPPTTPSPQHQPQHQPQPNLHQYLPEPQQPRPQQPWTTALMALLTGAALASGAAYAFVISHPPTQVVSQHYNSLTVESIQRQEKIVLLSLGIQGIDESTASRELFGFHVPGSDRQQFVQYNYRAQLGIDGSRVDLQKTGEKSYKVIVPQFEFLGHSDAKFKIAVEKNGVLSWTTPEINSLDQVNAILNDETKHKHLQDNTELLQQQAQTFYTSIIRGIDPQAELQFEFR